jgi:outer membrane protein TolC
MKQFQKIFLSLTLYSVFTYADSLSFPTVWSEINKNSAAQESSRLQTESLTLSKVRASRHWLPRIYLDAQGYQTNDAGNSFFSLLSQRSLQQSDFNPDSINHPDTHFYTRGSLGVEIALYEGGLKTNQVEFLKKNVQAQESMTLQIQTEQYAQVSQSYASIAVLIQEKIQIEKLNQQVDQLIKNYQLGQKSNPVGYSGLLGMKSLANRITGLKNQFEAQIKAYYSQLNELGLRHEAWTPDIKNTLEFVDQYVLAKNQNRSHKVQALRHSAEAAESASDMEKAKFLPRIGAFAESTLFNGNRTTSDSYIAGIYLQWSLFDASNYGSSKEAQLKQQSIAKSAEALEQQESAEKKSLQESIKALRENIKLIQESTQILIEQTKVTESLFKNGSLNILQFVEILNRRTDLIVQQSEAELAYIKSAAQIATKETLKVNNQ